MASPAQVANDMAAHAAWWSRRDAEICRACQDAARVIRAYLAGQAVDGRTYFGLHGRLTRLSSRNGLRGYPNFFRAQATLEALRREARR